MKNKILIYGTILVIILQVLSLIGFICYNKNNIKLLKVPVANRRIYTNTIITDDMIDIKKTKDTVNDKYFLYTTDIVGKKATKDISPNEVFSPNNISSGEISFNYFEKNNINNNILKPFLSYNNIYYYYTDKKQSLEVSYMNKKYTIDDIIRLNVISLENVLNKALNKETNFKSTIYYYKQFNIQICNDNNLFIIKKDNNKDYCN